MEVTRCQFFLKQPFLVPSLPLEQEMTILESNMEMQREVRKGGKRRKVSENISLASSYIMLIKLK